ncbi:heat shock protein STI-like, partial [Trifolium medium]|nr:heat shock protein STI-like [Trifolium medium]
NEYFKQQKYPEAIKHYTESIKRNPNNPKAYFNRAKCYIKLGELPEGLKDAEKCIELDPTFTEGYTWKAVVQFFMKQYEKAYKEGLKHDTNKTSLLYGVQRCVLQINRIIHVSLFGHLDNSVLKALKPISHIARFFPLSLSPS